MSVADRLFRARLMAAQILLACYVGIFSAETVVVLILYCAGAFYAAMGLAFWFAPERSNSNTTQVSDNAARRVLASTVEA